MEKKENLPKHVHDPAPKTTLPVVIDLGKQSRKAIKRLGNGEGKLMLEVEHAVAYAHSRLPDEDKGKTIVPVVIIYSKKSRRRPSPLSCFPLSPFSLLR